MSDGSDNIDEFVQELTRCQVDLFYFIRALTGDMHAAYDIRQAVNMVLWKKREKYRPGSSFKNWSFQETPVARNDTKVAKGGLFSIFSRLTDIMPKGPEAAARERAEEQLEAN